MNAATSGEPTMAGIISLARKLTQIWLAAAVPMEANQDADLLSHPATSPHRLPACVPHGWKIRYAHVPQWAWMRVRALLIQTARDIAWSVSREQALRADQSSQQSHGSRQGNNSHSHPYLLCLGVM